MVILLAHQPWLIAVLAYGFWARVLTGPTLSPLGQLVTRVVTPLVPAAPRNVPGPPKRFAQGIGATLLMRLGIVPEEVCEACNDLSLRHPAAV